jgi:glycerate kinase
MRIVIAPDKFKGCLAAAEVADAIAQGVRRARPDAQVITCPMADGGEGTVDALVAATGGRHEVRTVTGPLPSMRVAARLGVVGDGRTAVVEMAAASGLALLRPEQRDPMRTTTYGTGELLLAAAELGARRIIVGIGGSATVDGGIGCAQAWGARFTLNNGVTYGPADRKLTGGDLSAIHSVHTSRSMARIGAAPPGVPQIVHDDAPAACCGPGRALLDTRGIEFIVACDVGNPLFGPDGAAPVFGPQKGATPQQVEELDAALKRLAELIGAMDLAHAPGAGAAGGLGFGLFAFFGATVRSGIDIVIETTQLRQKLAGADLCITGEGQFDAQSLSGKTPIGVARLCRDLNVPCIVLAGSTDGSAATAAVAEGVTAVFSIAQGPAELEDLMRDAPRLLSDAAAGVMGVFTAGRAPPPRG